MNEPGPDGSARTVVRGAPHVSGTAAAAMPLVVKLGGRALEAPDATGALADDLAAHEGPLVLVHGGGAEVSDWSTRLGVAPQFADGLRVTDAATIEIVAAVLAGLANKRLVAALRHAGLDAVGIAALDGGVVEARPHPDAARLGRVGVVHAVRVRLLNQLWRSGRTPVMASLAEHAGALLNINADDVASALAAALGAQLVLLSDVPGLVLDGEVVPHLTSAACAAALARPDVTGGMRPKLHAALAAIAQGATGVTLAQWSGRGTLARASAGRLGTTIGPDSGAVAGNDATAVFATPEAAAAHDATPDATAVHDGTPDATAVHGATPDATPTASLALATQEMLS